MLTTFLLGENTWLVASNVSHEGVIQKFRLKLKLLGSHSSHERSDGTVCNHSSDGGNDHMNAMCEVFGWTFGS